MTHVGSDLIFTPLDDDNDWLIAKMAFEMNDLFHGQIFHLSNTHDVAEPVHQAALRTLSKRHPVRGYLDRCKLLDLWLTFDDSSLLIHPS